MLGFVLPFGVMSLIASHPGNDFDLLQKIRMQVWVDGEQSSLDAWIQNLSKRFVSGVHALVHLGLQKAGHKSTHPLISSFLAEMSGRNQVVFDIGVF